MAFTPRLHFHRCLQTPNGVPYIDPISHVRRRLVLGARPCVTLSSTASSVGCDGRYSSTLLADFTRDGAACSTPTPLAVFARGGDHSTPTPLAASADGGDRSTSTPHVASTCGSMSTRYSRSTLHAASTGGGDCSSSSDVSTSISSTEASVVSLSAHEIAQL